MKQTHVPDSVVRPSLRRATAGDLDAFGEFLAGLSTETSTRRFFTPTGRLPTARALTMLRSDRDRGAWLALLDGELVGHACWALVGPRTAEVGLVVADRLHGHGIGTALGEAAIRDAVASGVGSLEMLVQGDNRRVLRLIAKRWPDRSLRAEDGVLVARASLLEDAAATRLRHISSWVSGSPSKSRPSGRPSPVMPAISSSVSSHPNTSRFAS